MYLTNRAKHVLFGGAWPGSAKKLSGKDIEDDLRIRVRDRDPSFFLEKVLPQLVDVDEIPIMGQCDGIRGEERKGLCLSSAGLPRGRVANMA